MSKFLLDQSGHIRLLGGKPLIVNPVVAVPTNPTTAITLTPLQRIFAAAKYNIQTTAASNDTTTDVPYMFTFAGGQPTSIYARVIDVDGTAIPGADWTNISDSVTVTDGVGIGYLTGVRAGARYRRQIRVGTNGAIISLDGAQFSVGPNGLSWGQSNMIKTLIGGGTFANVPGWAGDGYNTDEGAYYRQSSTAFFTNFGFIDFGHGGAGDYDYGAAGGLALIRNVADRLKDKAGREIGFGMNVNAFNGTGIGPFLTVGQTPHNIMVDTGTDAGTIGFNSPPNVFRGDYRVVAWHQGEASGATITRAERLAVLKQFCQMHLDQVAKFGRPPSKLTFLFAIMGVYPTSGNVPFAEVLRGAVYDLVTYAGTVGWDVRVGWNCIDLDPAFTSDDLHFGGQQARQGNRRLTQAFQHVLEPTLVPYGAAGPRLTGAVTRSGDNITLTVAHEGGTGLAAVTPGSPITGWYGNTALDFSGTDIAITNVTILSATQIRVTATGAPATFYIKHCGHKYYTERSYHPDVSNLIYDNFVYPTNANALDQMTGLPLQPTPDAIRVG
jgi:hypothetical protein